MTLVTGSVQDLGYDGMEGTLWARPARFRSDGQVVYAPERKPYKVVDGVVSADLAPGPAVLELQVGSHARGTFEVVIPEEDTTLADLLDTVFPWEPAQVSLFVAEREAAELAKTEAEAAAGQAVTAAGTATSAAQQAGQDRSHVDQVRTELDEAFDESTAGNVLPPRLTETALNATYAPRTHVVVGPNADFPTVADALAAHPTGHIDIEMVGGVLSAGAMPANISEIKNVGLRGQGREVTTLESAGPFIDAISNSDAWHVRDFHLKCTTRQNVFDGIKVDYPRRWLVERVTFEGFGGTSLWYRGGSHSTMQFNYAIAKDAANVNGHAGFRCDRSAANVPATAFASRHNYVGSGKLYGFLFERTNIGSVFDQDVAELCDIGMRFDTCIGELRSPYTEANRVAGIQQHDSNLVLSAHMRDLPAMTWAAQPAVNRRPVHIGQTAINIGNALIFGPTTGPSLDPTINPSIRWGSGSPEGLQVGVPSSLWLRTNGFGGQTLYVKESGTGNTGWEPVGVVSAPASTFLSATSSVNTQAKRQGRQAYVTGPNRPVWATGSNPTDTWVWADGTVAYTPVAPA